MSPRNRNEPFWCRLFNEALHMLVLTGELVRMLQAITGDAKLGRRARHAGRALRDSGGSASLHAGGIVAKAVMSTTDGAHD